MLVAYPVAGRVQRRMTRVLRELPPSSLNAIGNRHGGAFLTTTSVGLRVAFAEVAVRDRVKQAGGTWNPERRIWQLRYDRVVALGLKSRVVAESASNSESPRADSAHLPADARTPLIEMLASTVRCPGSAGR